MTEHYRRVKYSGIETAPVHIQDRINENDSDQEFTEYRGPITIAGANVPERTREIAIYDAGTTDSGEHQLFAAINHGPNAIISIVSTSGPTPDAARWRLGRDYNLPNLAEKYSRESFAPKPRRSNDPL